MYIDGNSDINDIINRSPLYYLKGDEEEIKSKEVEKKQERESRQRRNPPRVQGGESRTHQTVDSGIRENRVSQLPATIGRNFDKEGEELVQSRKECLKNLKSLIRASNLTINTELSKEESQFLNEFKIVETKDKKFYIRRNVFYNGDREKVRLLIEELRNFYNKGHAFTCIK
jgi:hypothetical protein